MADRREVEDGRTGAGSCRASLHVRSTLQRWTPGSLPCQVMTCRVRLWLATGAAALVAGRRHGIEQRQKPGDVVA
jgi:hypothetical protein